MTERVVRHWQTLSARERRLVLAGGVLLLLLAVWLLLFEPAWRSRQEIRAQLPLLYGQLAEMDRLAIVASEFAGAGSVAGAAPASRQQLEGSLDRAGLLPMLSSLTVNDNTFDLRFDAAPWPQWLAWTDSATRELRLRVADVSLARTAADGLVSGRLVLEVPR